MAMLLVVRAMLCVAAAVEAGSRGPMGEPVVQIDATGIVRSGTRAAQQRTSGTDKLMRQAVRPHAANTAAAAKAPTRAELLDKVLGLLEVAEVDSLGCTSETALHDLSPRKLCKILTGSNSDVAGKLHRAVKGLDIRPKSAHDTEMIVADQGEEKNLSQLRGAFLELWNCAKRSNPPCDPLTSTEKTLINARSQASNALEAIHKHPKAKTNKAASSARLASKDVSDTMKVPTADVEARADVQSLIQILEDVTHSRSLIESNAKNESAQQAQQTMRGLLAGSREEVMGKLWKAINRMDVTNVLEHDIVDINADSAAEYKTFMRCLKILHECASMPDCPASGCCIPANPTQQIFIDAQECAYKSYEKISQDTDMAGKTYLDLLAVFADHTKISDFSSHQSTSKPSTTAEHHSSRRRRSNTTSNVTSTASEPASEPEEGGTLLIALIMVTGIVVGAVAFLLHKTKDMQGPSPKKEGFEQEAWGAEGEGYPNY